MNRPLYIPEDYDRIAVVSDESAFFKTEMKGQVNCVFMTRQISGDFNSLAQQLYPIARTWHEQRFSMRDKIYDRLSNLAERGDSQGYAARCVKRDFDMLTANGFFAELRTIDHEYYEPSQLDLHMDSMPIVAGRVDSMGTVVCSYIVPTTSWVRNDECNDGLRVYRESSALIFNLKAGARKYSFQPGDMVRMASEQNLYNVKGFIHCAERIPKDQLRLLLLARIEPGNR